MQDWQENKDRELRLRAYLETLEDAIGHADRREPLRRYLTGLFVAEGRKSVEPLAALGLEAGMTVSARHQSLLHLVGKAPWSDAAILETGYRHAIGPILAHGAIAAWVVDDTGHPKAGNHSVGVARQYCGNLGKVDNCQVAVSLSLVNETASIPVGYRLYLPKAWADDLERRRKVGVPDEVEFQTKPEIALDLLDAALAAGKPKAPVLADAGYGDGTPFRDALSTRGLPYLVGVKAGTSVFPAAGTSVGAKAGEGGKPMSVEEVARSLPEKALREVLWREGGKSTLSSRFAVLRACPAHGRRRRPEEWLLIEWPAQEAAPTHYWLGTVDPEACLQELVELAKLRWRIERDYEELKQELGLSHYEGRGWRGFHHHASLCIAAYAFLAAERAVFSPLGASDRGGFLAKPALSRDYRPRGAAPRPATPADVDRYDALANRS
jgi:SRSO17 transposase